MYKISPRHALALSSVSHYLVSLVAFDSFFKNSKYLTIAFYFYRFNEHDGCIYRYVPANDFNCPCYDKMKLRQTPLTNAAIKMRVDR